MKIGLSDIVDYDIYRSKQTGPCRIFSSELQWTSVYLYTLIVLARSDPFQVQLMPQWE